MMYLTTVSLELAPPLLRLAHPMAFCAYLHTLGTPVDRYMRRSGLPVLCEDPDTFVPLTRAWTFFDIASRNVAPELGWLVGEHVGDQYLNAAMLNKIENAPTLLQALHRFLRLYREDATDLELGIEERRDGILFYTRYSGMSEAPGYHVSQAYQLGVILGLIRHFLGREWVPQEIGIESAHVLFGVAKCFPDSQILPHQPAGYIGVPRECLHQGYPSTDTKEGKSDYPLLNENLPAQDKNPTYLSKLRAVLRSYLTEGYISQQFAAELMNTSASTLARRLSVYGLTYGALIDEIRYTVAKEKLSAPKAQISEVAQYVGFKDQGDFTRMFRRVGGLSPKEYRNSVQS
jgi:AraC-like DNA-binding protein